MTSAFILLGHAAEHDRARSLRVRRLIRLSFCAIAISLYPTVSPAETAYDSAAVEAMASRAEKTVQRAFKFLWNFRMQYGLADSARDTSRTGVIGVEYTALTTTIGYEDAKELSTKPGWATWVVKELVRRGIGPGSRIAVSMTGSFPALNIAVLAALQELDAKVHCISSVGSSSYGANEIGLSWPEMERLLWEEGILHVGSRAVTLGGTGDRGAEWDSEVMDLAARAVKNSLLPLMKPMNLRDAIAKRMEFYGQVRSFFCYINIGGNQASLGSGPKMRYDRGGWFLEPLAIRGEPDGVMDNFLSGGVPCLNLLYLRDLIRREHISLQ